MKTIGTLVFLMLIVVPPAFSAQIYGSLKEGDRSVGAGVKVIIECAGGTDSKETDGYGSYNLYVRPTGKCTFRVYYQGKWSVPFTIYSYDDPVRYDFELIRQGDGQYALKRK
jgi:hypothetical protein